MKRLILALFLAGQTVSICMAREFMDDTGRKINAEIVGYLEDSVNMKIGTKIVSVKIAKFSKSDQIFINEWITKNPDKAAYTFRYFCDLKEDRRARSSKDGAAYEDKLKTYPKFYHFIVTNATSVALDDVTIQYQIYVNDVVDTNGNAYAKLAVGYKKQDKLQTFAGKVSKLKLDSKGRLEFNFPFVLNAYVDRDGGRVDQAAKDSVIGIRVRVFKGDKQLDEYIDDEDSARFKNAP